MRLFGSLALSAVLSGGSAALAQAAGTCQDLPHADHPLARLSNGRMDAAVFLPDKDKGYYRASRFDWSGLVGCVSLDGHRFFGEWFGRYDPLISDAVTGPAEEFRNSTSEIGYDEAPVGGTFLKIGVGVLKRVDDKPYSFGASYPIVDGGKWTVKVHKDRVVFRQELRSALGYGYVYEKVLSLDKGGAVLSLTHHLKNTGTKPLETAVYDHDFFMLDGKTTGPGMEIRLKFAPVLDKDPPPSVQVDGNTVRFVGPLTPHAGLGAYVTGFTDKVSDYDITFVDTQTGMGIEQTSDSPISRMYFWATPRTVCPEAYIGIHVAPGATQDWTIHYRMFTK